MATFLKESLILIKAVCSLKFGSVINTLFVLKKEYLWENHPVEIMMLNYTESGELLQKQWEMKVHSTSFADEDGAFFYLHSFQLHY